VTSLWRSTHTLLPLGHWLHPPSDPETWRRFVRFVSHGACHQGIPRLCPTTSVSTREVFSQQMAQHWLKLGEAEQEVRFHQALWEHALAVQWPVWPRLLGQCWGERRLLIWTDDSFDDTVDLTTR